MQSINILLASQKTDKGEENDSGLHRCQNQMCPSSYYLHVDTILPVTGTIGLFIVFFRPMWFKKLVDNVYTDKNDS